MSNQNLKINLQKYATLIVQTGVHVQAQDTVLLQIQTDQTQLAQAIVAAAYQAGAKEVLVDWQDQAITKQWLQYAPKAQLTAQSPYRQAQITYWCQQKVKRISVLSEDPNALDHLDPQRLQAYQATASQMIQPLRTLIHNNTISWTVVAAASGPWASMVFPDVPQTEAVAKLWAVIFEITGVTTKAPATTWTDHLNTLKQKAAWLNGLHFDALHFQAPGTDLIVGLPTDHLWLTAQMQNAKHETFVANLPTEEVFTAPDRRRIDGTVQASRPVLYAGQIFTDLTLKFKNGHLLTATAQTGQAALQQLLATDMGAKNLGEVALVPHTNPIAQSNLIFYNTLLDENTACHLALGAAYPATLKGGLALNPLERQIAGLNQSALHMDIMIGTAQMTIDGLTKDSRTIPVFRHGDWII